MSVLSVHNRPPVAVSTPVCVQVPVPTELAMPALPLLRRRFFVWYLQHGHPAGFGETPQEAWADAIAFVRRAVPGEDPRTSLVGTSPAELHLPDDGTALSKLRSVLYLEDASAMLARLRAMLERDVM